MCRNIKTVNLKLITKPHRTIRQTLVNVKNRVPEEKKTGVVYEVPCHDCDHVYTGRTLKKRLAEHKQAVRRFDEKNGIAVHVHQHDHHIDWESARVVENETFYWKRRVMEAILSPQHHEPRLWPEPEQPMASVLSQTCLTIFDLCLLPVTTSLHHFLYIHGYLYLHVQPFSHFCIS